MRKLILASIFALAAIGANAPASAQSLVRICVPVPGSTTQSCQDVSSTNPLPVTGANFNITGFTPNGNFATITATGSSGSNTLPNGTTVAFQNVGTVAVSCTLGIGSATATANQIVIQPGSTKFAVIGSNTFGACIDQTGSTSNIVVLAGGAGIGIDSGGGSGGGNGSSTGGGGFGFGALFQANGSFATLTASATSGSVALPTGTAVVFQNTGTTSVSCTLGIGSATASANQNIIPPNSAIGFLVGTNTFGACIDQTGAASNVVALTGGTGSQPISPWIVDSNPGSNLLNAINSPIAVNISTVTQPASGFTAGGVNSVAVGPVDITGAQLTGYPAGTFATPSASTISVVTLDPCSSGLKSSVPINITTATTTGLVAQSGTTAIYVCGFSLTISEVVTTPNTIKFESGTGAACVTTQAALTGIYGGGGVTAGAPITVSYGGAGATIFSAPASGVLCAVTAIGGSGSFQGVLTYVQQ